MRKDHGFTLIELLIVVAIIVIIAARAIPNLRDARMRSNESNTINLLRQYADAQQTFRTTGGTGGYADDFTVLRTGAHATDSEKRLDLIDKDFAAARAPSGTPVHGYLFAEPTGPNVNEEFWTDRYALLAVPAVSGHDGGRAFYIDNEGVVLMKELPEKTKAADSMSMETPLQNAGGWMTR